mmetsp:Transcript_3913/g.8626  ORF Transcript_3913/g.8626 Transcript_3913/m.8626 type:complete len:335 (+) Transcript_3913:87-1091(+)
MAFIIGYEELSTLPAMCVTALGMSIGWGLFLDSAKHKIYHALSKTTWWKRAMEPMKSMMVNFGYPREPTDKFPNGITESMARDSYAYLVAILFAHFFSAVPMIPVLMNGWEDSTDVQRSLFLLGSLSDVGFSIYDSCNITIRTFFKHNMPTPLDYWFVMVPLHHTTSMLLSIPMNLYHVHRVEYHQTAVSLLMAAVLCYSAGCYKFSLDVAYKKRDLQLYKAIALYQLGVILYTRVYLWFPAAKSFRHYLREQNDMLFFYGASIMIGVLSLFNLILVVDGLKAVIKSFPKKFPETKSEKENTTKTLRRASGADFPPLDMTRIAPHKHEKSAKAA